MAPVLAISLGGSLTQAIAVGPKQAAETYGEQMALYLKTGMRPGALKAASPSAAVLAEWDADVRYSRAATAALLNLAADAPEASPPDVSFTTVSSEEDGTTNGWVTVVRHLVARDGRRVDTTTDYLATLSPLGDIKAARRGQRVAPFPDYSPVAPPGQRRIGPDIPAVANSAWTSSGRPGIWLSSPYWGLISRATAEALKPDPSGVGCAKVARDLGSITSGYVTVTQGDDGTSTLCLQVASLKADGRWNELLQTLDDAAADPSLPMILPRPPDSRVAASGGMSLDEMKVKTRVRFKARYFSTEVIRRRSSGKRSFGAYNRGATLSWAQAYWNSCGPGYFCLPTNDCTNWVSQLMNRGGFATTFTWYQIAAYGDVGTSTQWKNVMSHRAYFWNNNWTRGVSNVTATVGDILYWDFQSNGVWDHTNMVTVDNGGWNYVTGHRSNYLQKPVVDILNDPTYAPINPGFFAVNGTNT